MDIDSFISTSIKGAGFLEPTKYQFSVVGPITTILPTMREGMNVSSVVWPGKSINTVDTDKILNGDETLKSLVDQIDGEIIGVKDVENNDN